MFLTQMTTKIKIPKYINIFLESIKPYVGGDWDRSNQEIKTFKRLAKIQLMRYQEGKCAYCGLSLATRSPEMEHIAPKGGPARPNHIEFTFLPINLVLACRDCNSPGRKGTKDTISIKRQYYSQCEFIIVHPYLDNPNDYFDFIKDEHIDYGIIPLPKKGAPQQIIERARNTIKMFGLDSEGKILSRAQEKLYEIRKKILPKEKNIQIEEILLYKY